MSSFLKTVVASSVMGGIGWVMLHGELWKIHGNTYLKAFYLSGTVALCVMIYIFISYMLKSEEFSYVVGLVKQKFGK